MNKFSILLITLIISHFLSDAQVDKTAWDNTADKKWPVGFKQTEIKSSADSSAQKAIFYKTGQSKPQPLIVSLHTWSGNFTQEDPLTKEILLRDWNYIHPDFRGANNTPQSCGSELVIQDIEDAIQFAIKNGNVDKDQLTKKSMGAVMNGFKKITINLKRSHLKTISTFRIPTPHLKEILLKKL